MPNCRNCIQKKKTQKFWILGAALSTFFWWKRDEGDYPTIQKADLYFHFPLALFCPKNIYFPIFQNLTNEFMDLNFANRRKLCKNSVFYKNMNIVAFVLFAKIFISSRFCSFQFRKCIPPLSLFNIDILRDGVLDLKI